jgi:hypothetical protein
VKFLDRFEQFFERLVEGSIGRLFRNQIQPAEIERKLERAMTSHQLIGAGAPIVPNDFSVKLNPVDLTPFESYLPGLCRQMEMWLQGIVDERDLTTIDQIKVQISGDDAVRRREIVVDATDRPRLRQRRSRCNRPNSFGSSAGRPAPNYSSSGSTAARRPAKNS